MSKEDTIVCGICGGDQVRDHCDRNLSPQCTWSVCQNPKCGAFGHGEKWVTSKKKGK